MPRGRSAPRSASAAAARPRPAASTTSRSSASSSWSPSKQGAPPPVPTASASAPPPALSSHSGGGLASGLMGSIMTGMAFGTGSAVAHRTVDSVMGPREARVVHEETGYPAPTPATPAHSSSAMASENPCELRVREFGDCMSRSNGDMAACNFYFEAMQACKVQNRMV